MDIATTYEILLKLQEMLGDKGKLASQATLRTIMNTRIIEGTPVWNHMIRMIAFFNKMKIFWVKIDEET